MVSVDYKSLDVCLQSLCDYKVRSIHWPSLFVYAVHL